MDNIAHTLAGAALARAGLDRLSPRATATLLVASNLPDLDSVARLYGPLSYMEHHRGLTHSILGVLLQSFLVALVLTWTPRLSLEESIRKHRAPLLVLLSATALSLHLFMDYTNSYGIRPLLPWDDTWWYGDLVFIIDPWVWLLLGGGLFMGSRRGQDSSPLAWAAAAFAATGLILFGVLAMDIHAAPEWWAIWVGGLAAAILIRRFTHAESRAACQFALVALAGYWIALAVSHHVSLRAAQTEARVLETSNLITDVAAIPLPAAPFRWLRIVETDTELVFDDEMTATTSRLARNLTLPEMNLVRQSCTGAALLRFFRFPAATLESSGHPATLILRDTRFSRTSVSGFGAYHFQLGTPPAVREEPHCPGSAAWLAP